MGPEQALQLQAVFKQSQELIRGGQVRRVVAPDVAAGAQCGQCVHRGGDVQGRVGAAVNQLQQLHRELDIAQTTGTQFDLPAAHLRGHQ